MTYRHTARSTAATIFCLLALLASETALAAESKRVMLLHSVGRDFKPWSEYAKTIRTELDRQSPWPLEIIEQSVLTARSAEENSEVPFVEYLHALFAKRPLDLIVSIGAPAANFVQRRRQQLFATTPMVLTAVAQRRIQRSSLTENDTVVAHVHNFPAVIENILHVLPDTKTVAVVNGNSPGEQLWLEDLGKEFAPFAGRLSFIWYNDRSFADILKHAAALPPHSAIFWHQMNVDAAGVIHEGDKALPTLHAVANAPIFSFTDAFFGGEVVGGPMADVVEASRLTVAVALRILGGEKAGDIQIPPVGFATPKFDWRLMQRWGISESRLPPGSEIHFREPSVWERYRLQTMAIIATFMFQAALISWLIYEHRRRNRAEILVRSSMAELTHLNRVATAGELSASIAHEVNQPINGIVMKAGAALRWLSADVPNTQKVRELLTDIVNAGHRASEVVAGVRAMFKKDTNERVPVSINKLVLTVLEIVRIDCEKIGVEVQTDLADQLPEVLGGNVQLQQVVLNLVMNAIEAMHFASPRRLRIETWQSGPGMVRVSVADTGVGIDPSNADRVFEHLFTTKSHGMGMGLAICRSIIENHGGRIWVLAGVDRGSILQFELPTNTHKGQAGAVAARGQSAQGSR